MKYSIMGEKQPIYETDEDGNIIYYTDEDGNQIPLESGNYTSGWSEPKDFKGNIAMSGGEAEAQEFGLNLADYQAILVVGKNTLPITETSLIWHENEPKTDISGNVDEYSADYRIIKVGKSLNVDKYVLKKVVK